MAGSAADLKNARAGRSDARDVRRDAPVEGTEEATAMSVVRGRIAHDDATRHGVPQGRTVTTVHRANGGGCCAGRAEQKCERSSSTHGKFLRRSAARFALTYRRPPHGPSVGLLPELSG